MEYHREDFEHVHTRRSDILGLLFWILAIALILSKGS